MKYPHTKSRGKGVVPAGVVPSRVSCPVSRVARAVGAGVPCRLGSLPHYGRSSYYYCHAFLLLTN